MAKKISSDELKESFEHSFNDILAILKAIGNQKRLKILITLLSDDYEPQSFHNLMDETQLQKTALSNHLTILINNKLIEKPEHGKYKITSDCVKVIKSIEAAYYQSYGRKIKQLEVLQRRKLSDTFLESFFEKKI